MGAHLLLAAGLTACGAGTAPAPTGTWTHEDGRPAAQVQSHPGEEHCGWDEAVILTSPREPRSYVRDPEGVVAGGRYAEAFDPDAVLPADAVDTGLRLDGVQLWLGPGGEPAYLRDPDGGVEAWPATEEPLGCD
ncbi:hypothetical protein CLV92_11664 [Kineococcus xinjiangensis]|uniref:Uncharacterized protein n=1 Tax=Kineococcus xinjiangensis TaxID=512762 RepID=A0A2S6IDA5_9ACTN|nr:hypothetical protein [Kineococcus xinjiangensis]PPK92202.1 hypothetical protein CLV92_11664 [Kineococcus xinjiangensis]